MTDKAAKLKALRLKAGLEITPAKPADTRPRWPSGALKDPLDRLEEEHPDLVAGRWQEDPDFFEANQDLIRRHMLLKNQREKQEREQASAKVQSDQAAARAAFQKKQDEEAAAKKEDTDAKRQAEIDRWYETGGAGPIPK